MAKKRTIIEQTIPDDDKPNIGDVSDIIVVLTKVYKVNAGSRSFCFQTQEPVDEVYIQAQYPSGGKFIAIEYNSLGETVTTNHFDIEPKPIATLVSNNGIVDDVRTRMLMEELNFSRQIMLQMINGLFNNKNVAQATPITELVAAMQGIHAIVPPSSSNPIDLIIKGMELGSKATGNGPDWKAELIQTAKDVLPQAMQMMSAARQIPQQGNPNMPVALPPATMLKQGIQWIKSKIISGSMDPEFAVEWLIRNANDEQYQPLLANAIQGNIDTFIAIDSEISNEPYRTWFTTAIQLLKEWYEAQQQGDDSSDSDRGTGNGSNVAVNAESRSRKPKIEKVV